MNEVTDVNREIEEAKGWLKDAIQDLELSLLAAEKAGFKADQLNVDSEGQWPAVKKLAEDLEAIRKSYDGLITPEIRKALEEEEAENQRLEDMADRNSY